MIPDSITKPISAITLTSLPLISSPRKPPVNASGMVNMMINGDNSDWNCATMIRYMKISARISIRYNCCMASVIVSFSPVISMV